MSLSSIILGRPKRRKSAPPKAQARGAPPEPAAAPAAAVRRSEPEPSPAKRVEPAGTIRAILIDPVARTLKEVQIPTERGDERNGYGVQLKQDAVTNILGSEDFEQLEMTHPGEVALVDALSDEQARFWRYGEEDEEPVGGIAVLVGYDGERDAYRGTALSVADVRKAVKWGVDDETDAAEMRTEIVSRIETLDGAQLGRLLQIMDGASLQAEEPDETTDQMKRTT